MTPDERDAFLAYLRRNGACVWRYVPVTPPSTHAASEDHIFRGEN